MKFKIKRRH